MKIVITIIMCITLLLGCTRNRENQNNIEYDIVIIEGMTCIKWEKHVGGPRGHGGLTCNWGEWKGEARQNE